MSTRTPIDHAWVEAQAVRLAVTTLYDFATWLGICYAVEVLWPNERDRMLETLASWNGHPAVLLRTWRAVDEGLR